MDGLTISQISIISEKLILKFGWKLRHHKFIVCIYKCKKRICSNLEIVKLFSYFRAHTYTYTYLYDLFIFFSVWKNSIRKIKSISPFIVNRLCFVQIYQSISSFFMKEDRCFFFWKWKKNRFYLISVWKSNILKHPFSGRLYFDDFFMNPCILTKKKLCIESSFSQSNVFIDTRL